MPGMLARAQAADGPNVPPAQKGGTATGHPDNLGGEQVVGAVWQKDKKKIVLSAPSGASTTLSLGNYTRWRFRNKATAVCAHASAPGWVQPTAVFEKILKQQYRLANLDKDDLLAHWWWQTARTGIQSDHDRARALATYARYRRTGDRGVQPRQTKARK